MAIDDKELKARLKKINGEEEPDINDCPPCKINAAIGILLGNFGKVDPNCEELCELKPGVEPLGHKVLEGKMSIREMAEALDATEDIMDILEEENVPLDLKKNWEEDEGDDFVSQVNAINAEIQKQKELEAA